MPAETTSLPTTTITKPITDTEYTVLNDQELERPYRVIIQNDDVTPMEFVIAVLLTFFDLAADRAIEIMLEAHSKGRALVTTLPYKEAQERVYAAQSLARNAGYPLSFYLEPDA